MAPTFFDKATMYGLGENGKLSGDVVSKSLFPVIDEHFKPSDPTAVIAYH